MKKTSAGAAAGPARGSARAAARGAPRRPPAARKNGAARAPAGPGAPVRERIVEAGLALLRAEGAAGLSQHRVARAAGVRQSHVTYYFPHRTDLVTALAQAAVAGITTPARAGRARGRADGLERIGHGIAGTDHMRMHLALVAEADRDPALREVLVEATRPMLEALAAELGVPASDPRAAAVLAALWGVGMYRFLVAPAARDDGVAALLALVGAPCERGARPSPPRARAKAPGSQRSR